MQRYGNYPGYALQEVLDSPRFYQRFLAVEDTPPHNWVFIQALGRDIANTVELRLFYQDSCRQFGHIRGIEGLIHQHEIGMSRTNGVFSVYSYTQPQLGFGEIAAMGKERRIRVDLPFYASILRDAVQVLRDASLQRLDHFAIQPSDICITSEGGVIMSGFVNAMMRRRFHFETELDEKFDAPEWRRHEEPSFASDIYSIAALLYQAITGEFQPDAWEPRWMGMMDALNNASIPGESLTAAMEFFERALAADPGNRFSSYDQFLQALDHLIAEAGHYTVREIRADILKDCFPLYPPFKKQTLDSRSDVISLITGDEQVLSPSIISSGSTSAISLAVSRSSIDAAARSSEQSSLRECVQNEDTLTMASQNLPDTRVLQRSSSSFRKVSPTLRTTITASPIEILARSRYQILEELGAGGMGTVYKVLDTTLTEILALKVLKPELVSDAAWLQRFKRELKIARDLEHAYILPAYHLEQINGLYFFTMRYVDGSNLSDLLHDEDLLPMFMRMRILSQIGQALVAAHDHGIIHRDIKPANIMVENDTYHPYLMDFGIASAPDSTALTMFGQGIGTPSYMAPEQSRGDAITIQADIFSFGVVCYECIASHLPFVGTTPIQIYTAQESGIFEPISSVNSKIPASIAMVVEACLSPNPGSRPTSMRAVLNGFAMAGF